MYGYYLIVNRIAKAIAAGIVSGFALYQTARGFDSPGGVSVLVEEWRDLGIYTLFVSAITYLVPNADPKKPPAVQDGS